MTVLTVRHTTPSFRTYSGENALDLLSRELDRPRPHRVMLMCGASMLSHREALERVESALGERLVARFAEAREHSPLPAVEKARELLVDSGATAVVALGGGSAVVTARAAVILAGEGGDIRDLCTRRAEDGRMISPRLSAPKVPIWVVPSTPTTAYAKAGAAVRDPATGERLALFDPKARAAGVVFDPVVASTAPAALARSSALNAFAMAVDGMQSTRGNPLAEALLGQALTVLGTWIGRIDEGPGPEAAVQLMFGALLAGQGSDHAGTGLAQALSHALGPRSTVGNGVVEALLLPHTIRFNLGVTDGAMIRIARVLGVVGAESPSLAIAAVEEVLTSARIPRRLREVGIEQADLPDVVDHTLRDWAVTAVPRPASSEDLRQILDQAW
ncbi:iron-containing alcohol dehydrogenase family protein [Rhodococcus artemisiae]|uniref:Iron-containing alcohol dehydrogenase family protein n=1 Tax=Rhodococcus artemisiae TaxID=714159 RepID=A0ABU7LA78_9NOCA|nr:iron-containing alcohol dehydrogenase family protein [Rhodococcus artemisiae]MEE2058446.1 iron-containing alcohol dehydrogenase family protein [Rhodococcus artemisiae]